MYAENIGTGSAREPREMIIPIGSSVGETVYAFFILNVL
jgi:hypothetical protein